MKRLFSIILILALAHFAFADLKVAHPEQHHVESLVGHVEDQVIIKFEKSTYRNFRPLKLIRGQFGVAELDALAEKYGSTRIIQRFPSAPIKYYRGREIDLKAWFKIQFSSPVELDAVVTDFLAAAGVIEVQKIGIHAVSKTPNDGNYSDQWHLNQSNDYDIDAPEAWDIETGDEDVIVAILDTGVRYFHKDLGGGNASYNDPTNVDGNIWINSAEKNGADGVDDDGNGYVDDWVGWDFVDGISNGWPGEDASTEDNDPRDFNGHGTHCSGIVASINNNGYATASPAGGWGNGSLTANADGVKIMPLRIGYSGRLFIFELGYVQMDFAASAFYYAANNGADIASCSWGSSNSGGLGDAIDYFLASGGMIFKAAGNDDNEASDYMTDRSDIIAVASTDQNDLKSDFSTYGTWVDISAPGTDIYSTYHDHEDPENDYIASLSGTSMATPLTAGIAAAVWSQNPSWSASQVEQQLYDTVDDIYSISGNSSYQGKLGVGRVNAFKALGGGSGPLPPNADFVASPTSGCAPLAVNFTDQSTGDVDSWSWNFGDGGSSTTQNPSHSYNNAGTYTVTLTVTGPGGSDVETKTDHITVTTAPTAAFVGSPINGDAPLAVSFTDQSTGGPTSWSWDLGDGSSSTSQNPSHTYNAAGTYTVSLTATNSCGSDVETKVDYITVTDPPCDVPVAEFIGTPLNGDAPLSVSFTDQSTNTPTSWSWTFGDGGSSTQQNPSHTYNAAGIYTVTLTATNSCGSDGKTKVDYITVTEPSCDFPVAAFTATPQNGDAPLNVSFTDQSTNTPTSWSWDFGDGGSSTQQNPSHTYTAAGTYTVTLTATNSCGSDDETKVDYVIVTEPSQNNELHVGAIEVTKQTFWRWSRSTARVRVLDQNGSPVANATVSGDWSGSASGSASFDTGSDGWGETSTGYQRNATDFTFCVINISKAGYTYNVAANVATCGSTDGTTSQIMTSITPEEMKHIEKDTGEKLAFASPNPFNPSTNIIFMLPEQAGVKLDIYNVLGKRVSTLYDQPMQAGMHTAKWDAKDDFGADVGSGHYFYVLSIDGKESEMTIKGKLLYIK